MSFIETTPPIPPRPVTQREVARQLETLRQRLERQLKQAQQAASAQATKRSQALMEEQARKIQKSIDALDAKTRQSIDAVDRRHREQLDKVTKRVYADMDASRRRLEQQTDRKLKDLADDVTKSISSLEKRTQRQFERQQQEIRAINDRMNDMETSINRRFAEDELAIAEIQADLKDIHQRFESEEEQARQAVNTARALLDVVEKRTLLDRFAPGYEAEDIRERITGLTEGNLRGAALTAKADEALTQILQVERHATQEKAKHDALVEIALSQIEKVLTIVNDNRVVIEPVEGGEPMEVENEFWSEGEYGRLEEELGRLKAELADRYNPELTADRVKEIARRSVEINERILQISAESVAKSILSEARVETVEDIVNAMGKKGWLIKHIDNDPARPECDYMGGEMDHDWRKGFAAVLENNVGDEVTVIVDPVSDSHNVLVVHQETARSGRADREVAEKMQSIRKEMCDLGYEVGAPVPGEIHIPEMGSIERLGRAHATERIHQKLDQQKS